MKSGNNTVKVSKTVVDTLLFFYFGFTLDDAKEAVLQKVIKKAYDDATMMGAFNTLLGNEEMKDAAKTAKEETIKTMMGAIDCFIVNGENKNYDEWHKETCNNIKEEYKKQKINDDVIERFSYGNSQKVVNMTMKYLYMLSQIECFKDEELKVLLIQVNNNKQHLHIPIDSYIIDAIWKHTDVELSIKDNLKPDRNKKDYKQPSDYVVGWSTWTQEEYIRVKNDLLNSLNNEKTPLDWESDKWIEIAKERNN